MRRTVLVALLALACCGRADDPPTLEELSAAVRARKPLALLRRRDTGKSAARIAADLRKQTAEILATGWRSRDRPFPVTLPIDWGADPFRDRNWRFQLSSLEFVIPFLQLHEETGDPGALRFARDVFLDWTDYNLVRDRPNDFRWYDHATGKRAALLAYVLDRSLRTGQLTPPQLDLLLRAAREHVHHLADPRELAPNNHALFQLAGLAGLCAALPELDGCDRGRPWAAREFTRIVASQFNEEGIHSENSPSYQGYALESIDLMLQTGWLDLPADLRARLDRAWVNLPWLVRPDGQYAAIGDSSGAFGRVQRALVRARAGGEGVAATHRAFPAAGYAIVRVPSAVGSRFDGYLFLTAAFNSRSHKHRDALSFEWFDAGVPILIDTAAYSANLDDGQDYARSSRAHNTIEVDGGDIDGGLPRPAALAATARQGDLQVLAAEVTHADIGVRHRRVLLYAAGRWLLVHDEVTADAPHTVTAWFHLPADAWFRPGTELVGTAEVRGAGALRIADLTGRANVIAVRGQSVPRLEGWVMGGYGQLVESDAIGLSQEGSALTFDTLFLLGTGDAAPALVSPSCWTDGRATHGARVAIAGGRIELSPCDE
jgi:hypothetical protein